MFSRQKGNTLSARSDLKMGSKFLLFAAFVALAAARSLKEEDIKDGPVLDTRQTEVLYKLGHPLKIDCNAANRFDNTDTDDVIFSWKKNGKPLSLDDNTIISPHRKRTLIVLEAKKETEGNYQCFVATKDGVATSGLIKVRGTFLIVPKVQPKRLVPLEGAPFQLECPEVQAYPKPKIRWMYQHGIDSSISHTILDPRITTGPNGFLYFSNVTEEDVNKNFKYVCTAKNSAVDEPVSLAEYVFEDLKKTDKVGYLPRVPQYYSHDMTTKEGDVTEIFCIYGGTPLIPPDWFFNDKLITGGPNDRVTEHNRSKGKRLIIRDTQLSDQGEYKCVITELDGVTSTFSVMKLTVVSTPKVVLKPKSKTTAVEGSDITLQFGITGKPDPKITWTFNGKPLNPNDRAKITVTEEKTEKSGNTFVSTLIIKDAQKNDAGYYGCKATNENGEVYEETLVTFN